MSQRWNSRKISPEPRNITQIENTIANKLQNSHLIERCSSMELQEIKLEFLSILNDKTTVVKESTRQKYIYDCEKINNITYMYYFLTNFLLKADGLGIN